MSKGVRQIQTAADFLWHQGSHKNGENRSMQIYLENLLLTTLFCWQQRYETGTRELEEGEKKDEITARKAAAIHTWQGKEPADKLTN